ncbi:HAD hydrolase, family IB [Pseudomonas koreensis]|uniref:HAD hydrolase, family IB n=1 Tax=Pseudomonas koreensis TaxID=198620 RepID=A0AA94EHJ2_9PSED|nr:HAD hydrolase, family IB [Pseudomonas koreensis]
MALAIFDLDETLIHGDCATLWSEQMGRLGWVDPESFMRKNNELMDAYSHGKLRMEEYMAFSLEPLIGRTPEEVEHLVGPWVEDFIEPIIFSDATKTIAAHRKAGDRILVISASGTHLVKPIADRLGIDEILGIELDVAHGVYSGQTVGTLTYREGKITRLLEWLDAEEENLEGASFYSDSRNDLPLLLKVDFPHVVNPDPVLLDHAEQAHSYRGLYLAQGFVNHQYQFPRNSIARQLGKRCFGILHREGFRHLRTQPPFGKQRPDLLTQITQQISLELIVTTAQCRTEQLHTLGQYLRQVQFRLTPAHQTDQHPATVERHQLEVQRGVIAADRIEDHVKRTEVAQALQIIAAHYSALGAQRFAVGQTLGRADADPARVAERLAQLNRR